MTALSSEHTDRVLAAAVAKATDISLPANIAVLDAGVNLKAFTRMDGALLGSIDIALGKARTSALFQMNTEDLFSFAGPGGTSYGLENTNGGLVVFAGGRPLIVDGEVVGAIGVSGGTVDQDDAIAKAGADALSVAAV